VARKRDFPTESGSRELLFRQPALFYLYEDAGPLPESILGQYPRGFLATLLPWLRCKRHELLHVCSGSLPPGEGLRVDLRAGASPDVLADGRKLPFRDGSIAAVLVDPPYAPEHAASLYGTEYPRPSHLLREACRVVRPCGRFGIVHFITPNPPPGSSFLKCFGLSTGFGFQMRAVVLYEKDQAGLW
jgi:SAM-dependent methyltransferase